LPQSTSIASRALRVGGQLSGRGDSNGQVWCATRKDSSGTILLPQMPVGQFAAITE
jgi:hypothetical protein